MITVCKIGEVDSKAVYIREFETGDELVEYFNTIRTNAPQPKFPVCNVKRGVSSKSFVVNWKYSEFFTREYPFTTTEVVRQIITDSVRKKTAAGLIQELYDATLDFGEAALWDDDHHEADKRFGVVIEMIRGLAEELGAPIRIKDDEED